jgi:hypothetical protein
MALNPRMVNTDTNVTWDGGTSRVKAGTVVDIANGSALETAYGGAGNLTTLSAQQALNVGYGTLPDGDLRGTG